MGECGMRLRVASSHPEKGMYVRAFRRVACSRMMCSRSEAREMYWTVPVYGTAGEPRMFNGVRTRSPVRSYHR